MILELSFIFIVVLPFLHRNVCSGKTSLRQHFVYTGVVLLEPMEAPRVNVGTLLSKVQNVQLPCLSKVLFMCPANLKILIVSAILRAIATISAKERCAWDSGLVNALDTMEIITLTLAGNLYPGSL